MSIAVALPPAAPPAVIPPPTSPASSPVRPSLPPVPPEYEPYAARAEQWLAMADLLGVIRFDAAIDASWRPAPIVEAWQAKAYHAITAGIELSGSQINGVSMIAGPPPAVPALVQGRGRGSGATKKKLKLTVGAPAMATSTSTITVPTHPYPPSTCTAAPPPLPPGTVVVMTLPTPTRGRCKGCSKEAHTRWVDELRSYFSHPGQLAGRFISFVLPPWKLWGKAAICEIMSKMRKVLNKLTEEFGVRIIGKGCWKPNDYRPHWHFVIIIPETYSQSQCQGLSNILFARVDAAWRRENKQGLKDGAWKLKRTAVEVRKSVEYLSKHETKDDIGAGWGLATFRAGPLPTVRREFFPMDAQSFQRVWAALSIAGGGLHWHPWATKFSISSVEPRKFLMILRAAGVPVTREQLERYIIDW